MKKRLTVLAASCFLLFSMSFGATASYGTGGVLVRGADGNWYLCWYLGEDGEDVICVLADHMPPIDP